MEKIFTIDFEYKENQYGALIRVKKSGGLTRYCITVMNGDLERLLYGNNILSMENGILVNAGKAPIEPAAGMLQRIITQALDNYLKTHIVPDQDIFTDRETFNFETN